MQMKINFNEENEFDDEFYLNTDHAKLLRELLSDQDDLEDVLDGWSVEDFIIYRVKVYYKQYEQCLSSGMDESGAHELAKSYMLEGLSLR
jgi:hypothetical protein